MWGRRQQGGAAAGRVVVEPGGDGASAVRVLLRQGVRRVTETGGTELVVDLHGLQELDTGGLAVLVAAARRLDAAGARLTLLRPPAETFRVLRGARLHRVVDVVTDPVGARL